MNYLRNTLSVAVAIACLMCAGCSPSREKEWIDQIEERIRLPEGARPMEQYSRYYALDPGGRIWGSYTVHLPNDFEATLEACREHAIREFPCSSDGSRVELVPAGESLWIDDYLSIPAMAGGGCSQILFQYDPASGRFFELECNGDY